jgi:hypothetical protein
MDKHEFMSPAWLDMARGKIGSALAEKDLSGVDYTLCEEFTNPPPHLRRDGAETIGFCVRIEGGRVAVDDHPESVADLKVISDYADALPVARDPDAAVTDPAEVAQRMADGRLKIVGDPASVPPVLTEVDVHRLLAPQTA